MPWIARLIGLLLALVLADAAVSSGGSLPAMLPATAASAGLALAALVFFWARPWIAGGVALLLLFGVFAYGSFAGSGGPPLTGLSAADAEAVAFVLAIVASVVAVWTVFRNGVVRALVSAVALYLLLAPVASIGHGGLAASFGSAPLAATRGSYGAAEVLFPLGALVALAGVVVFAVRKRGAEAAASLVLALALAAATQFGTYAAGAAGLPTIAAFEHPRLGTATISTAQGAVPTSAVSGTSPANVVAAGSANASADATPGPRFIPKDADAVPAEVAAAFPGAKDPEHALASVAALGNDVYPGALAGAVGVVRSGSGNSIDKSLLLRDLLRSQSSSIETQFAECTLSDADADVSIANAQAAKQHGKLLIQSAGSAVASVTQPDTQKLLQEWARAWTSMVGKTKADGPQLASALASAGVVLPQTASHDRLRAAAGRHVWLQAKINGAWVDLDPTIDAGSPGKTRCAPRVVSATLPDDAYDVLDVRVTEETRSNGEPQQTVVLDRSIRSADIGDRAVSFVFAELTGVDVPSANAPAGAGGYTPLLYVGDENVTGTPIILPIEQTGGSGKAAANAIQNVAGLFDSSPAPVATSAPLPIVSGVWLDLGVTAPGTATTRVRRPIFDRLGIAVRAGLATPPPLGEQPASEDYTAMQTEWNVAVSAGHVASGIGPATLTPAPSAAALGNALARVNGAFYSLRRALMDEASGSPVEVAAAQPGISVVSMTNDGAISIDSASDASVPLTNAESRPLWATASLLAEREVVHRNAPVFAGLGAGPDTDVLAAFDQAVASGVKFQAFHSGDTALTGDRAIPSDTRARMSAELAGGASLFALPLGTRNIGGPFGYWVIDPVAGTLRDENADGFHQAAAEYDATNKPAVKATPLWKKIACGVVQIIVIAVVQDSGIVERNSIGSYAQQAEEAAVGEEKNGTSCGGA